MYLYVSNIIYVSNSSYLYIMYYACLYISLSHCNVFILHLLKQTSCSNSDCQILIRNFLN